MGRYYHKMLSHYILWLPTLVPEEPNRYLLYLSLVLIFAITLSLFSVSIRFIEKLYSFFETYTSLPIVDFLINFNFLYLSGLILLLYRCWRKAAIKQEELEDVINSITPYVLIVADQERNIIMCSSSLKRMYGYEVNEVINQKTDLLYSDMLSNPEHNNEILDILGEEGFYAGLAEGKKKDGKTIPLEIITGNLRGRGGTVSLLKDITQRRRAEEALRESEERFRGISASAQDGIVMMDNEGNISYWNDVAEKIFGYTKEEVIGKEAHVLFVPQRYYEAFRKGFSIFRETGQCPVIGKTLELSAIKKHGSEFPIELSVSAVKIQGKWHSIGIARDITDRKGAREELKASEVRFRNLVEATSDWVWEVDAQGIYTYASPRIKDILGYEISEVVGKTPFDLMPPDEAKRVFEIFSSIAAQRKPFTSLENINRHKDSHLVVLETSGVPIFDDDGAFLGYRGIDRDITRRKVMEDELRRKDWAIESSINGIGIADLEGHLTYVNQSFLKMWGYDEKEVLGKHLLKFCQKKDEVVEAIKDEGWIGEMKARRKNGSLFDVSFSASMVKDKNNNPICMLASFIDITENVQLREKLHAMSINDELTGLYNRRGFLNMAERELKIAKRKKRTLVLFFADLDGLKWINDTFGHNEGDQALIDTGNILKKTFREVDIIALFGGDEFVILAIDASKSSAEILTTRLYENLTAHNSKETCRYNLSLSLGISCYDPEIPASLEELISQADSAMYEQKKSKRKIIA
jgi:diguanylate cyclase (GGDEF)-like protein/PAS domain S-box-containing protein